MQALPTAAFDSAVAQVLSKGENENALVKQLTAVIKTAEAGIS